MLRVKNVPLLDASNGRSGVAIGDTLAKAAAGLGGQECRRHHHRHSTTMTVADLKEYSDFNKAFLAAVQEGKKAGRSADEIAASWKIPAAFAGYATPQAARLKSNIEVVLAELKYRFPALGRRAGLQPTHRNAFDPRAPELEHLRHCPVPPAGRAIRTDSAAE